MRFDGVSRGWGCARAFVLSWLAVAASAAAHFLAAPEAPAPGLAVTAATVLVLGMVSTPLFLARYTLWRSGIALLVQQLLAHVALSLASGMSTAPSPRLSAALTAGHSSADVTAAPRLAMNVGAGEMTHTVLPSPTMLAAHAGLALALGWALASAEQSWWTFAALQRAGSIVGALLALLRPVRLLTLCVREPATRAGFVRAARFGHLLPVRLADAWCAPCPPRRGPPRPVGA